MYSLPVRLNTVLSKRYVLQCKRVLRTSAPCSFLFSRRENFHSKSKIPIVHGYQYERNSYGNSIWTRAYMIFGVLMGSAAVGAVKAFCQKRKNEDNEKDSGKNHVNSNRTSAVIDEMRNLDLDKVVDLEDAIRKSVILLNRKMEQVGAPGISISVSVNGKTVWTSGFGFADIENYVHCSPKTVMRIASISKPITMTLLAKLWEDGRVDLDAPIQKYVPYFPVKTFNGEEVNITTRQLISHSSGIRHYKLKEATKEKKKKKENSLNSCANINEEEQSQQKDEGKAKSEVKNAIRVDMEKVDEEARLIPKVEENKEGKEPSEKRPEEKTANQNVAVILRKKKMQLRQHLQRIADKPKKKHENEFSLEEYHLREKFVCVEDAVKIFMDDELFFKPGTDFLYTTHGWTLVSAVIEDVVGKPFTRAMQDLFHELGLRYTYLDEPSRIIYNRASYYRRDATGRLENAPYVDNSYKWAGGGFLSTVEDLTRFGNILLYSGQRDFAQNAGQATKRGYLKSSTVKHLWTPVTGTGRSWDRDGGYGWGWGAVEGKETLGFCHEVRPYASHTGGAVGASSVLLILPKEIKEDCINDTLPQGVVVTMMTNLENVGLNAEALEIAKLFEKASVKN